MNRAFQEFLGEIDAKRAEIRCSKSGAFYRGHARITDVLVPSLLRQQLDTHTEHNLYHECYARAHHALDRRKSSWEFLSLLQHYGIPTRLLDWSESMATALFFAVAFPHDAPHIWIVNAFNLNRENAKKSQPRILMTGLDPVPDYFASFISIEERVKWPYTKPIFVHVPWISDRIAAQKGYFSIHPDDRPLEATSRRHVRRVALPLEAIADAKRFLELAGVSEHSVFPDFVGLAGFLRRRYGL